MNTSQTPLILVITSVGQIEVLSWFWFWFYVQFPGTWITDSTHWEKENETSYYLQICKWTWIQLVDLASCWNQIETRIWQQLNLLSMFQSMLCIYLNLQRTAVLGSYFISDSENCWFWFFEKKKSESKNCQPWLFQTPLKNQPFSWKNQHWTGTFMASYLIFPVFWELDLWVFRTMVMNPKNHVDNHQGSVPLSQHFFQFLSKWVFLLARTLEKHIFFWEKVANTL